MNKDIFEHNIKCLMNVIIKRIERKDIITYGEEQEIQSIVEEVFYQSLDELVKENKKLQQELQRKDNITNKAMNNIMNIFRDENWYENYDYDDLVIALKDTLGILRGDKE